MQFRTKLKNILLSGILVLSAAFFIGGANAYADEVTTFSVSPMNQKISLNPGERYYGTFKVTNPADNAVVFNYEVAPSPFKVNDSYEIKYENNGDYSQILDWITVEDARGTLYPNETNIIHFYIDVPNDAPAGGQYVALIVKSINDLEAEGGVNIQAKYSIAHILYAEVAGETVRKGAVNSINVPGFLFSGNISGTASITNSGNVHSDASHTLQIFPLFSKEEVYTNEEDPTINTILPEATRTTTIAWEDTPSMGIFHVIYKVDFEGVESTVDKYVIVCPLWLLFLIILALFLLIFRILSAKKHSPKSEK